MAVMSSIGSESCEVHNMERNLEPSLWSHPAARMDPRLRARKDLRGIRVGILHSVGRLHERTGRHCTRTTAQQTNDEYANCCCPSPCASFEKGDRRRTHTGRFASAFLQPQRGRINGAASRKPVEAPKSVTSGM